MANQDLWAPHQKEMLEFFCEKFYWTSPYFLGPEQIQTLYKRALEIEQEGLLEDAAIGKGVMKKKFEKIRSDKIRWIDDFSHPAGQIVQNMYLGLQSIAKEKLFLPAKRFECHFAKYEKGDLYKRHSDRHNHLPGRLLSCVVYLSDLAQGDGGELVIYDENLHAIKIIPEAGRIVVFESSLEHEVKPCRRTRWSITGWLREDIHPGLRI